jgi:hypothetical protein
VGHSEIGKHGVFSDEQICCVSGNFNPERHRSRKTAASLSLGIETPESKLSDRPTRA